METAMQNIHQLMFCENHKSTWYFTNYDPFSVGTGLANGHWDIENNTI